MILLHETYLVREGGLDDFEGAYWEGVVPPLREMDGIRPLWLLRQRTGIEGEVVLALTAVRSGEELGRYIDWTTRSAGVVWRVLARRLTRDYHRKALMSAPWSPLHEWSELEGLADALAPRSDEAAGTPRIFMEDTGWPYADLSDYVEFQRREYWEPLQKWATAGALLKLWGFFLVLHGTGRRPEAVFLQEVLDNRALENLIGEPEVYDPNTFPGSYMVQGLTYRDQWRSRLLVASTGPAPSR
ncbi:MAG: hypothetical protein ACYCU7_05710 [Acidimicrobiales bacterium]